MKIRKRLCLLLVALALAFATPAKPVAASDTGEIENVVETRWGALAAIGCGFGQRIVRNTGGSSVGVIAGTVALCLFAMIDALSS